MKPFKVRTRKQISHKTETVEWHRLEWHVMKDRGPDSKIRKLWVMVYLLYYVLI